MRSSNKLSGLIPLLLFALLATSVLTVLLTGTKIYARVTRENTDSYLKRTSVQYVYTRLMQTEDKGAVYTEDFMGAPAIVIPSEENGEKFVLKFYCMDGYLCELFTFADNEMTPEDGEKILKMSSMDAKFTDELLKVTFTTENSENIEFLVDMSSFPHDKEAAK